jgi:molecular chaperone DnaK
VQEAEEHSERDRSRLEWIDLQNQADGLIYSTERTLDEFSDHVTEEDRSELSAAIVKVKEALEGDDTEALRTAVGALSSRTYQMTESLYAQLGDGS